MSVAHRAVEKTGSVYRRDSCVAAARLAGRAFNLERGRSVDRRRERDLSLVASFHPARYRAAGVLCWLSSLIEVEEVGGRTELRKSELHHLARV